MAKKQIHVTTMILLIAVLFVLGGCASKTATSDNKETLQKITVVLDYVPNTNHTGLYVAQDQGYYKEEGLDVSFIEPGQNNTSATLVAAGKGQFGVSYQEDVTYALTSKEPLPIQAIATILKHNTSGFVSLPEAAIDSPKDFEGKVYAGWQSPSEEAIIHAVMKKSGADFTQLKMVGNAGGGAADLGENVDLKWFFAGWDSIRAEMDGIPLNFLPLKDLDARLDYYTPLIISNQKTIENDPELVHKFLRATKKGYQYAIKNPTDAAKILGKSAPEYDSAFLKNSQEFLSKNYTDDPDNWGLMEQKVWDNYSDFMVEYKLIPETIDSKKLFTNEFLQ